MMIMLAGASTFTRCLESQIDDSLEDVLAAPALLAGALSLVALPQVVFEGEEDDVVRALLKDAGDGSLLLDLARAGGTHALTLAGPASLVALSGLAADAVEDLHLVLDEDTGLGSAGLGVEEGMDVGSRVLNEAAEGLGDAVHLPGTEGVGSGVATSVAGESLLAGVDETSDLTRSAVAVQHGLVADRDDVNKVVLAPVLDGIDLLGDSRVVGRAMGSVNEDTEDHLAAVGLTGGTDVGEGVAVGGVGAESGDTGLGEGLDVLHDIALGLAVAVLSVGSVSHGPGSLAVTTRGAGGLARLGLRLVGRGSGDLGDLRVDGVVGRS